MSDSIVKQQQAPLPSDIEKVLITGDLTPLTPEQRVAYYNAVCQSVGLNPLTQPFEYLRLNNKLVLYAKRGATDQVRVNRGISIEKPDVKIEDGLVVVTVTGKDRDGRTDSDMAAVPAENLRGEAKANAVMKCITKAKRRLTLAMAGLGMLDETEIDSIQGAMRVPLEPIRRPGPTLTQGQAGELADKIEAVLDADLAMSANGDTVLDAEVVDSSHGPSPEEIKYLEFDARILAAEWKKEMEQIRVEMKEYYSSLNKEVPLDLVAAWKKKRPEVP